MEDDLLDLDDVLPDNDRQTIIRAPFNRMGGKYRIVRELIKILPYDQVWVEHFCGSAIVSLNRSSSPTEVINDAYGGIACFYRTIRNKNDMERMIAILEQTVHSREEFFYAFDNWNRQIDQVERAALWFYMMRTSVMGIGDCFYRATNNFKNKIPEALKLFEFAHCRLKNFIVENLDWEQCLKDYDTPNTVHYFDPPYVTTAQMAYDGHTFNRKDLDRLIKRIHDAKGYCAISHYKDPQLDEYNGWTNRFEIDSHKTVIATKTHMPHETNEVLYVSE